MLEFIALAQECAPTVEPRTMAALVQVESSFNPYAIGVVGGRLARQPATLEEAVATARALEAEGWNFSLGVAQVNRHNLPKYELTYEQAFDPCASLRVGSKILEDCYSRALDKMPGQEQEALQAAFSCYYSGNFTRGFRPDKAGESSYVEKVLASADNLPKAIPVVPAIKRGEKAATPPAAVVSEEPAQLSASPQSVPAEPADHASVLVDLTARQQRRERADKAASAAQPSKPADQADGPVTLKAIPAEDADASKEEVVSQDVTFF